MDEKKKRDIAGLVHGVLEKEPWPIKFSLAQVTDLVMAEKRSLPQGITDNEIREEIESALRSQRMS